MSQQYAPVPAPQQPDLVALLHSQYQNYTIELGNTHQALSKLYKRLARIERTLAEREERQLTRKEKKKLQWSRSLTKSTVDELVKQQVQLCEHMRQCNELIASYGEAGIGYLISPITPYPMPGPGHLPPTPYAQLPVLGGYAPVAQNPWMGPGHRAATSRSFSVPQVHDLGGIPAQRPRPQYWDLSMLRERRPASPYATGSSADSGFNEPPLSGQRFASGAGVEPSADPEHVFAHELMSPTSTSSSWNAETEPFTPGSRSHGASMSSTRGEGRDRVPELVEIPSSPTRVGADLPVSPKSAGGGGSGHRRRFSEDAIRRIESRMAANGRARGVSLGPAPGGRAPSASEEPAGEPSPEQEGF
ncbi:hypothetical protein Tdes44962_MAKER01955 [Teratosphaeria destructans]|uniref:Uncharacterized protein n=1 Tax=Teratosphaeria destructans TaxID=418781 RepID=A0A9W7W448_9PEZI|nr:hypothetical protein Tdes44962_MAKER01955 [Teratosphaeria destructans]